MPKDNEVDEKVMPDSAERATPVAWNVIQIGARGSAFDPPNTKRAFTYDKQPGNVIASSLGHAFYRASQASAGDSIDRGLGLLKALQEDGFGVFMIGEVVTDHAATVAELRADRDSWREQAEDRLREWDKLRAEVERLREANHLYSFAMNTAGIDELKRRADAAERRVGDLEANDRRYRYLREKRDVLLCTGFFGNCCVNKTVADVDAAIDTLTGADPT